MLQEKNIKVCSEALLEKYYQNNCTPEEILLVEQSFINLEHYGKVCKAARQEWDKIDSDSNNSGVLADILHKIHFDIRLEDFRESNKRRWLKKAKSTFLAISAAVLIPLLLLNLWQWQNTVEEGETVYTEISAPFGSRVQFNLPDGSFGWLNSGSSLKFPLRFTNNERIVQLNGEGYFNVVKDIDRDFVVSTKYSQIRVLGTSFNVLAYSDLSTIEEVTLEKGLVSVEKELKDGSTKRLLMLEPGQHIQINHQSNSIQSSQNETEKYTAWTEGKLIFRNDPLERVIMNLERHYNIEIIVEEEKLYSFHFHATFEDETLFETLRLLKLSSAIDYKILPRQKNEDGRFEKQKIILSLKTK